MTRILHLSDTHFGTERKPVVEAVLDLARSLAPDLVVLSGDITQRARRGQFAAARKFIERLSLPVLAVPGNHDIPLFNVLARALNPYGNYKRALGAVLEPVFESDGLLAIGLNTTRPRRHKDGEISGGQIARVAQRLRQARPGQLRVVVAHHPVRAKVESDLSNLLIGRERALQAWGEAGVDLVLGGHIHLPYVLPLRPEAGAGLDRAGRHRLLAPRARQHSQFRERDRARRRRRLPGRALGLRRRDPCFRTGRQDAGRAVAWPAA